MTEKFTEFKKLITEIETRKETVISRIKELEKLILKQENNLDIAELNGQRTDKITENIQELNKELQELKRKEKSLSKEPSAIINIIKGNKSGVDMAEDIFKENMELVRGYQEAYDKKALELEAIKQEFLKTVFDMGMLVRNASNCRSELDFVKKHIIGKEKVFFGCIVENKNFISILDSEKAYKGIK